MKCFAALAFLVIAAAAAAQLENGLTAVSLGDVAFYVEIADDELALRRGLQGRGGLPIDNGMLFVFPSERLLTFWMHDVHFPLDIVFLDRCGRVVDLLERLPPCLRRLSLFCPRFTSSQPAQYALEINAGLIQSHSLVRGDQLLGFQFPNCRLP